MSTALGITELGAGTWTIDPVHSSIAFSARHLMVSKVRGTFGDFSGAISIAEDGTPSVTAQIAVNSLNTGNEQRDAHLKSADFFDAERFPTATFTSTGVTADGDNFVLNGDFTLKGVTNAITISLVFNGVNPGHGPRRGRRIRGLRCAEPPRLRDRHRHATANWRRRRRRQGEHHRRDRGRQTSLIGPLTPCGPSLVPAEGYRSTSVVSK